MKTIHMIDILIENIKSDRIFLERIEGQIHASKEEKKQIQDRLREHYTDIQVFVKYLDEDQKAKLDELNLDVEGLKNRGVNVVAQTAFDILMKAKDHALTNSQWYDLYQKALKKEDDKISYTAFNIKCRSLFNTGKVLRSKGKDSKSSKEDVISIRNKSEGEIPMPPNKISGEKLK